MTTKESAPKRRRGRPRKQRKLRTLTKEESLNILVPFFQDSSAELLEFNSLSHKHYLDPKGNKFSFTLRMLSLNVIISLMEHKKIKSVFFQTVASPPAADGSSRFSRYKVIVEYHMIEE